MQTQIELYKAQLRWEPWKALAAMIAASAVMTGTVLGLSNWLHPPGSQISLPPQVIFQPGSIMVQPMERPMGVSPAPAPAQPK